MDGTWKDAARQALTSNSRARVRLDALLGGDALPPWPCVLPWTRLELGPAGWFGPCCDNFQRRPSFHDGEPTVHGLWNGETMRSFRAAMTSGGHPSTCRTSCPLLAGATQRPADMVLRGGSSRFVEHQIAVVEALLAGATELRCHPLEVMFPPTTYCNHDCLMCEWGVEGTLDDELGEAFYDSLDLVLPTLRAIEVAGGEPLASPRFREFLARLDFGILPDLRVSLVTNGTYLTPDVQRRLERVPFSTITISLNAATPQTYLDVNRGRSFERVRQNLDALLQRRASGRFRGSVAYSMVVLRRNLDEIEAFAQLARDDDVSVRFMLPMFNRGNQSIMTDADLMRRALAALEAAAEAERRRGQPERARGILGEAAVLEMRLRDGLFVPLPDGRDAPGPPEEEDVPLA